MKSVYIDYNATTPIDSEVKQVLIDALDLYANGSSMHEDGRAVAKKIEAARVQVAKLINSEPKKLYLLRAAPNLTIRCFKQCVHRFC